MEKAKIRYLFEGKIGVIEGEFEPVTESTIGDWPIGSRVLTVEVNGKLVVDNTHSTTKQETPKHKPST